MTRKLAIALQIFLASAAFAAVPKPPSADDIRNVHAPMSDFLAVCWALNENTGTTATNIGKRSSYNGTLASAAWTSNAEGVYANAIVRGPDAAQNDYYPRGTWMLYANSANTLSRVVLAIEGSDITEEPYIMDVRVIASSDTVRVSYHDGTAQRSIDAVASYDIGAATWVPIVVTWGERGITVDTLGATRATNAATTGILFRTGYNLIANSAASGVSNGQRVHAFAWWDWQLDDRAIRELLADPFLPFRPELVEANKFQAMHPVNPVVGVAKTDSLTWQVGTPPDDATATFTKAVDWRIAYTQADADVAADITSVGVLAMSDVDTTGWVDITSSGAMLPTTVTASSLTADTLYVWQAQYREDAGTIQAFPGGIGYVWTRSTSGPVTVAVITDALLGSIKEVTDTDIIPAKGIDITSNGAHDQTMRRAFITADNMADWCFAYKCNVVFDLGSAHTGSNNVFWSQVYNDVFKTAAYYYAMGNQDDAAGWNLEVAFGEDQQTAQALVRNRNLVPVVTALDYTEGGESEGCPADPYGGGDGTAYCPSVSWVPGESGAPCISRDRLDDEAWDTRAEARAQSAQYLEFNTSGATWAEKLGALEPACSNGLGNYYGLSWGDAVFFVLDPYLYSAVGSDLHSQARADPEDWVFGTVQRGWFETAAAASTAPWKFVLLHQIPTSIPGGHSGTSGTQYWGRGSGSGSRTAERRWLDDAMRAVGAIGFKGLDNTFAVVEDGGLLWITAGVFSHTSRFAATALRWTYPLDYGDPSILGAEIPSMETMRPQWGWGRVSVAADGTATYTYRQTVVDQQDIDDQSTPDTWTADYRISGEIGDVLTVDASGNVTLTETPNDVLVLCDADDGDFLQYGWDAAIADTNWGGANDYSPTLQDWGTNGSGNACIDLDDFTEPHKDAVIATAYAEGTRVRVHYAPRDLYTATLHRAVRNPTYVPLDGTVRGSAGLHYRGE